MRYYCAFFSLGALPREIWFQLILAVSYTGEVPGIKVGYTAEMLAAEYKQAVALETAYTDLIVDSFTVGGAAAYAAGSSGASIGVGAMQFASGNYEALSSAGGLTLCKYTDDRRRRNLTHWPLGEVAVILNVLFSNSLYRIIAWALTEICTSENATEFH